MKRRLTPIAISMCLLGMISTPVFASANSQQVAQLTKQVAELQRQVAEMHDQMNSNQETPKKARRHHRKVVTLNGSLADVPDNDATVSDTGLLPTTGINYLPVDLDVPGQSFVSSGPYIGIPLQYNGSNLIINTPSVNNDVALLKIRKNIHQRLDALGIHEEEEHAHVLLSGILEGQATYRRVGGGSDSTDVDLTNATLDAYILGPSEWLSSLISFTYDNDLGTNSGSLSNLSRVQNSRIFLRQGFVTIGNLSKTPIYGTFGQLFIPFGTYSSSMISAPLTQVIGRVKARAIVLGAQPLGNNEPYAALYIFRGDAHVGSVQRVNNGGINLGYRYSVSQFSGDIGGGFLANIADSQGMQNVSTGGTTFNGFGGVTGTGSERISHRVGAVDLRGTLSIGTSIDLLAEYIAAVQSFSKTDMTMNNHGAKPQALNVEAAYTFQAFARPNSVALGYGMTKDAVALQVPAQRYSLVFNTSIWRDTLQSLEFRHDVNYGASNFATGSAIPAPTPSGRSDNAVTAQFDVYF